MTTLPPGSTIGILGGGQLGKMLAVAATQMGYRCHIYAPEENWVAAEVAAEFTCAPYDDVAALRPLPSCDVITYEFENVPVAPLARHRSRAPMIRPNIKALEIAQDRVEENLFASRLGAGTGPSKLSANGRCQRRI
jgi:5-(carboxyamino)imidazole ribonucleotide synthase